MSRQRALGLYGDSISDIDLDCLLEFHRNWQPRASAFKVRYRRPGRRKDKSSNSPEKPQSDSWASSAFFIFEPGVMSYLGGETIASLKRAHQSLAADGQLMAYRHDGFFYPMDACTNASILIRLKVAHRGRYGDEFGVTAQHSLPALPSELASAASRGSGRLTVVCLVPGRWVPQCELIRSGSLDNVKLVRGDIRDREIIERVLGEYEAGVNDLAAQTIVGITNRNRIWSV